MTFIETNCTVEHNGQTFESGGAFIADCSDGRQRGVVYAKPGQGTVTDWHGNFIAHAYYGREYLGNFCKMRSVSFAVNGVKFSGRYCPDWADMVRVRSSKKVTT